MDVQKTVPFSKAALGLAHALESLSQSVLAHDTLFEESVRVLTASHRLAGGADMLMMQDLTDESRFHPSVFVLAKTLRPFSGDNLSNKGDSFDHGINDSKLASALLDNYDDLRRLNNRFDRAGDVEEQNTQHMAAFTAFVDAFGTLPEKDRDSLGLRITGLDEILDSMNSFSQYTSEIKDRLYLFAEENLTDAVSILQDAMEEESPELDQKADEAIRDLFMETDELLLALDAPVEDAFGENRHLTEEAEAEAEFGDQGYVTRPDLKLVGELRDMAAGLRTIAAEHARQEPTASAWHRPAAPKRGPARTL